MLDERVKQIQMLSADLTNNGFKASDRILSLHLIQESAASLQETYVEEMSDDDLIFMESLWGWQFLTDEMIKRGMKS